MERDVCLALLLCFLNLELTRKRRRWSGIWVVVEKTINLITSCFDVVVVYFFVLFCIVFLVFLAFHVMGIFHFLFSFDMQD